MLPLGRDRKVKLNKRKIQYIIRHKKKGSKSNKQLSDELELSESTVKRVWSYYLTHRGEIPVKRSGRPKVKGLNEKEREIIVECYRKYKLGARRLEKIIERDHKIHIPHNRIHQCLLEEGLAKEEPKKKRRRKPYIRYEREHSMSAGHIDWYDKGIDGTKLCVILDDSSRKLLAGGEFSVANTDNSILVVDELVEKYWDICPMRELIMDNDSAFGAHRRKDDGEWNSRFKRHIESYGIKPIPIRFKHPQSNGKIEKFFDCYRKYRQDFDSFQEFAYWYNHIRPHESLDTKWYIQTPDQAFWSRLPSENILGLAARTFG